jgi:glycosyltransferase involved in cell wall biosynthesis
VDTGSSDNTKELISEILNETPGKIHERPWRDFGTNRTEAIELARGQADYLLFIDADEVFEAPAGFEWPKLTADAYTLQMGDSDNRYLREVLVKSSLPWRYVGILHEYLTTDQPYTRGHLEGPIVMGHFDGGRSQGIDTKTKYARDAEILEEAVKLEPNNTRNVFYLAQSYRDSDQKEKALEVYQRRAGMGGWDEEIWYSLLQVAILSEKLSWPSSVVADRYLAAYQNRPTRVEPLVYLSTYCRLKEQFALAHLFSSSAKDIKQPNDMLFLDASCYNWRALDEYAVACYYTARYRKSKEACETLLSSLQLPEGERARVKDNLNFALSGLSL